MLRIPVPSILLCFIATGRKKKAKYPMLIKTLPEKQERLNGSDDNCQFVYSKKVGA